MRNIWIIVKRETVRYFATPLAYVFIVIFLALSGALAFFIGRFMSREQADLIPFFDYHPWLYLLLIPAIAMRPKPMVPSSTRLTLDQKKPPGNGSTMRPSINSFPANTQAITRKSSRRPSRPAFQNRRLGNKTKRLNRPSRAD